jgi:hypothetical protein
MHATRLETFAWVLALVAGAGCSSSTGTTPDGGVYGPDALSGPPGDGGTGKDGNGGGAKDGSKDGTKGDGSKDGNGSSHDGSKGDGSSIGDGSSTSDGGIDGPTDGAPVDPVLALGACVGTSMPIAISGQLPYVDLQVGGEAGEFGLDFGTTFSTIYLGAFDAPGPTTSGCDASELGQVCTVQSFAFFGPPSSVILTTENYAGLGGSVVQAGLIGTDLLSEDVFTIDYAGGNLYEAPAACSSSALGAAGFVALTTQGFYENDTSLLYPATDTGVDASAGLQVPNVPTVPVKIAGVSAFAQLDTGFDDDVTRYSVNINVAFYNAITAMQSDALVRDSSRDETLTTCATGPDGGVVTETAMAYTLKSGVTFDFIQTNAMVSRSYANATIFVKETPQAAQICGGIGTWNVPAAQVGASFYVNMGSIIFDPFGATVWIPKGAQ